MSERVTEEHVPDAGKKVGIIADADEMVDSMRKCVLWHNGFSAMKHDKALSLEKTKKAAQIIEDLCFRNIQLREDLAKAKDALARIDICPIDYRIGVAENMQVVADIAHQTLQQIGGE